MHIDKLGKILVMVGILTIILMMGLWAILSHAKAQDGDWLPRRWKKGGYYHHYLRRDLAPRRSYYRGIEEVILEENRQRCLGRIFTDKGRELSTEESALKDAERSWASLIREERGEKYMDLRYAQRYESRCQRSSTGESATAKITETLTGGNFGHLFRCRIYAEPCTAPRVTDEKPEK